MKTLLLTDRDQFSRFDYSLPLNDAMRLLGGNSGNSVFQFSLQKILSRASELSLNTGVLQSDLDSFHDYNEINSRYDCIFFSPANILALYALDGKLKVWTEFIKKVKIPVYAVGLGVNSDNKYSKSFLDAIQREAREFVGAILDTGGIVGTRGYFTSECLELLGFKDGVDFSTIGCPSLFMNGRDLRVVKEDITENELRPAINGFREWESAEYSKYFLQNKTSIFVCQDEFYELLYCRGPFSSVSRSYLLNSDKRFMTMYLQDRIKFYGDYQTWAAEFRKLSINFSFGCRFHGNVVGLLNGIPSFIDAFDSRVRELSEYFSIPNKRYDHSLPDLYETYLEADYSKFNREFSEKFDEFERFMARTGVNIDSSAGDLSVEFSGVAENIISDDQKAVVARETCEAPVNLDRFRDLKKVIFVAHEFGLYSGHGGIASYLYNICKYLLESTTLEVFVISVAWDKSSDLFANPAFHHLAINGDMLAMRRQVRDICIGVSADYIEFADFSALGLECVLSKVGEGSPFEKAVLVTNFHSATKECYEWSSLTKLDFAPIETQRLSHDEALQMRLSDYCIAPSRFLANYVRNHYGLANEVYYFANPYVRVLEPAVEARRRLENSIDFSEYDRTFNILLVSRFEGRKRQSELVRSIQNILDSGSADIRLIMAGNSALNPKNGLEYRKEVFKGINRRWFHRIHLYDFIDVKEQEKFFSVADLVVIPSAYENQPVSMVEAVLRGIPVLASRYSGCADYTPDEDLLFNPFEEGDLERKIRFFSTLPSESRADLSSRQRSCLINLIHPAVSIIPRLCLEPVNTRGSREILSLEDLNVAE